MIPGIPVAWIVAGVVVLAAGGYILHCEHTKKNWAEAKAIGERQAAENAKQVHRDQLNKERSDENYQRNITRLRADVERVRRTSASGLSAPAAPADGSITATVEWAKLGAAIREYREGVDRLRAQVLGIVERGAQAEEGLNESKAWARGRER